MIVIPQISREIQIEFDGTVYTVPVKASSIALSITIAELYEALDKETDNIKRLRLLQRMIELCVEDYDKFKPLLDKIPADLDIVTQLFSEISSEMLKTESKKKLTPEPRKSSKRRN